MPEKSGSFDFVTTRIDKFINWSRSNSLWPMPFGTACCAIEMMATLATKYDLARFGAEAIRFSPRQSDLMIVSGRISIKMMPVLKRIYEQMPDPKWVISMGACASTGGVFNTYTLIQGVDQFIPVDVYVPGCPPRPEDLIDAVRHVQQQIKDGNQPRGRRTEPLFIAGAEDKHPLLASSKAVKSLRR
ncbi:MAG: NADH-quinone oxidoreductase subunit NuoB [Candidatus Poribacteria bacterium]|nr:NADH-quinone oxidoreductase subunit NuoB [Candidatus Poribacteria bacterium]